MTETITIRNGLHGISKFLVREDGSYDKETIQHVNEQYFKHMSFTEEDIWLDAGAHIGAFTCTIAPRVKRVVALEPQEENFEMLKLNVDLNRAKNVVLRHAQLSSETFGATDTLYLSPDRNTTMHSFLPIHAKNARREEKVLEYYPFYVLMRHWKINAVKINIEGGEFRIFRELLTKEKYIHAENIQKVVLVWHEGYRAVARGLIEARIPFVTKVVEQFQKEFRSVHTERVGTNTILYAKYRKLK